jgi:hypothetical protein
MPIPKHSYSWGNGFSRIMKINLESQWDYEHLTKYCEVNRGKIGSYDCTANCPHNENTRKEIEEEALISLDVQKFKHKINQIEL